MPNNYDFDPNPIDPIGQMVSNVTTATQVAEILDELADLHEEGRFCFTNSDMVSFLRGLSSAVLVFDGEPTGDFAEIVKKGQWRILAEVVNMALELE